LKIFSLDFLAGPIFHFSGSTNSTSVEKNLTTELKIQCP
jgi:hypothetical protein